MSQEQKRIVRDDYPVQGGICLVTDSPLDVGYPFLHYHQVIELSGRGLEFFRLPEGLSRFPKNASQRHSRERCISAAPQEIRPAPLTIF